MLEPNKLNELHDRLSNVTLAIRDELLTLEGFAELPSGQYEAQRWTMAFDKAHAK
jgi:hypothetical protein